MRRITSVIALLVAVSLYQEVTTTGNSEVNVQIESNVTEESGQTYRRVETNINGEQRVYESNEPGSFSLEITTSPSGQPKQQRQLISPTAMPFPKPERERRRLKTWFERWEQQLREWLQALPQKILPGKST